MNRSEAAKQGRVVSMFEEYSLARFKGRLLHGGVPIGRDSFAELYYKLFPGASQSGLNDVYDQVRLTAPSKDHLSHLVAFHDKVWDMHKLDWVDTADVVYSSPIEPYDSTLAREWLMELSMGDEDLARDYAQAIAPVLMKRRPAGVIWFIGDGANGKSALINAMYKILPDYLVSVTVGELEDGRAAPSLIGVLGNFCRESSEGRVDDTERYKSVGTHEPFSVRKFHAQEMITIDGDFHTIFSANNVPVFSDKTRGARRRTLTLPFRAKFADNPSYEEEKFTKRFLGSLLSVVTEEAQNIRSQGYRYKWSEATLEYKRSYDDDVNSVETFVRHLEDNSVAGFTSYARLRFEYESFCASRGLVPLGITALRRGVANELGANEGYLRDENNNTHRRYLFDGVVNPESAVELDNGLLVQSSMHKPVPMELGDEW